MTVFLEWLYHYNYLKVNVYDHIIEHPIEVYVALGIKSTFRPLKLLAVF